MKQGGHLTEDLLIRALDDELSSAEEAAFVQSHLAQCPTCQQEYEELRMLSLLVGAMVACISVDAAEQARDSLWRELDVREQKAAAPGITGGNASRRLEWGIWALAAAVIVFAVLISWSGSWSGRRNSLSRAHNAVAQANGTIEVDGETFVALPYSNPDLPVSASHIVQMEVSVASLADAGVTFEPISTEAANSDGAVLADVLIGLDGQPVGVHVLSGQ